MVGNKKYILIILIIILFYSSCITRRGHRPIDYPPAIWMSEDRNIWFDTGRRLHGTPNTSYGYFLINDNITEIYVHFDP